MFHSFMLTPCNDDYETGDMTISFLSSNWQDDPPPVGSDPPSSLFSFNYQPYVLDPAKNLPQPPPIGEPAIRISSSPLVNGRWYRHYRRPWTFGPVDADTFRNPLASLFDLAIPTSFFPFPSFHRITEKQNLRKAINEHWNPDTQTRLREEEAQTTNTEIFLTDQQTGRTPFPYPTIIHDDVKYRYSEQNFHLRRRFQNWEHLPFSSLRHVADITIPYDWGPDGIGILTPLIRGMLTDTDLETIHSGGTREFVLPFIAKTIVSDPDNWVWNEDGSFLTPNGTLSIGFISVEVSNEGDESDGISAGWRYSKRMSTKLKSRNKNMRDASFGLPFSLPKPNPHRLYLPNVTGRVVPDSHEPTRMRSYRVKTRIITMYQCREDPFNFHLAWFCSNTVGGQPIPVEPEFQNFPDLGGFLDLEVSGMPLLDFVRDVSPDIQFSEFPNPGDPLTERNRVRPPGAPMAMDRDQQVWNARSDIGMNIVNDWLPRAVAYHSHPNPLWENIQQGGG